MIKTFLRRVQYFRFWVGKKLLVLLQCAFFGKHFLGNKSALKVIFKERILIRYIAHMLYWACWNCKNSLRLFWRKSWKTKKIKPRYTYYSSSVKYVVFFTLKIILIGIIILDYAYKTYKSMENDTFIVYFNLFYLYISF